MSRSSGPLRPLLACAALLVLGSTLAWAWTPARAPAVAEAPLASARARASGPAALPDSVLARVGPDRVVTLTEFRRAWAQVSPPSRPDSLTPQTAREFLDLMISKEALGEAALGETWVWTPEESARVAGLRDRLMMALVLDSALRATQVTHLASGGDTLPAMELGTLARDESVRLLEVRFDGALLERLALAWAAMPKPPADSGIFAALRAMGRDPEIAESDLDRVVARTPDREFRVRELGAYWKRLNPLSRPRIQTAPQVQELVANAMYEDILRARAEAQGYGDHPDILRHLAKERELISVTHLVNREVYAKIPSDDAVLERFYEQHPARWDLPPRVRFIRLVLPERAEAEKMLAQLRDAAEVESLSVRARRAGLSYEAEYSADSDSLMFAAGMRLGEGGVMGPDSISNGWAVSRVLRIVPAASRPFDEVRELVRHAFYGEEAERLMKRLLDDVRGRVRIVLNEPALGRLAGP